MASSAAVAKTKLTVARCQNIDLLATSKPEKNAGFQAGASYCINEVSGKAITIKNDEGGEIKLQTDSWMKKWVLAGELQKWGASCVAPLAYSCVKNIQDNGKPVATATLSQADRVKILTPGICMKYRNSGGSQVTTTMKQVTGANGCDQFIVSDKTGTVKDLLSIAPKRKQAFASSGCAPEEWSSRPQECIINAFQQWESERNFPQLRNAFCGPNSDEYVPCWLG
jgi:hypothetical protein